MEFKRECIKFSQIPKRLKIKDYDSGWERDTFKIGKDTYTGYITWVGCPMGDCYKNNETKPCFIYNRGKLEEYFGDDDAPGALVGSNRTPLVPEILNIFLYVLEYYGQKKLKIVKDTDKIDITSIILHNGKYYYFGEEVVMDWSIIGRDGLYRGSVWLGNPRSASFERTDIDLYTVGGHKYKGYGGYCYKDNDTEPFSKYNNTGTMVSLPYTNKNLGTTFEFVLKEGDKINKDSDLYLLNILLYVANTYDQKKLKITNLFDITDIDNTIIIEFQEKYYYAGEEIILP